MNTFIETTIHIDKIFEESKRRSETWKNIRENRLEKTIKDLESSKGERMCWTLSDLIICLESPVDARIYTSNISHFEPLCRIVNKKLF
ncbi:MAG: hypothetical protein HXS54_13620 [Theionarchaea archaeon]|nr:hypothetical protein [Theionarchaea archaeon]